MLDSGAGVLADWTPGRGDLGIFPSAFADYCSTVMPRTILEHHYAAELLFEANGTYASAIDKILSYFITDLNIEGDEDELGTDEKEKYTHYLEDILDYRTILKLLGRDEACYGNTFFSLHVPFRRYLYCPECFDEYPLRTVTDCEAFHFRWSSFEFHAECKHCGYSGVWKHIDRRDTSENKLKVRRWNPKEIDIIHQPFSGRNLYIWRINPMDRRLVQRGYPHILEDTPWEVIQCVKHSMNLLFSDNVIKHMCEEPLAGSRMQGWGKARSISNFRQAWYVQVLYRLNEAVAQDFVVPLRVITPGAAGTGADAQAEDPVMGTDLEDFVSRVREMLRLHRLDPARWSICPYRLQYDILGGEANKLAPWELLDQGVSLLLNNIGIPVELYKGTLQIQAFPPALRLFESTWTHLVHFFNRAVQWLCDRTAEVLSWEKIKVKLKRVTIVDDMENMMARLQLAAARQVSQTDALAPLGLSFKDQQRKIFEEDRFTQEMQARLQKEMDQVAAQEELAPTPIQQMMQGGQGQPGQAGQDPSQGAAPGQSGGAAGMQPGGAPPGGASPGQPAASGAAQGFAASSSQTPNARVNLSDLMAEAQQKAQQMLQLPETQRLSELRKLKQSNPALSYLVNGFLREIRGQARSVGGSQMMSQQFGGAGGGGGGGGQPQQQQAA